MVWHREEYLAHCRGQYVGREMLSELFGLLVGLEDEWRAQGATPDEISLTAFDWDYVPFVPLAAIGMPSGRTGSTTTASAGRRSRERRAAWPISDSEAPSTSPVSFWVCPSQRKNGLAEWRFDRFAPNPLAYNQLKGHTRT